MTIMREGVAFTEAGAMHVTLAGGTDLAVADGGTGASTGQAAAANLGVPYVLAKWGVPVILASSGTMGNNGAVSAMTALPVIYTGGAWLYLPANAIQAGSAAGFYWFVASSTTAGTVYNSTFDGTSVPALGTTTAFSTVGPGAFTGIAAGEFTAATVTVPAGAMGPNGALETHSRLIVNTAAGNKIGRVKLGGTTLHQATLTTTGGTFWDVSTRNQGIAASQENLGVSFLASAIASSATYTTQNTAGALSLTITLEKATATNHAILGPTVIELVYGA